MLTHFACIIHFLYIQLVVFARCTFEMYTQLLACCVCRPFRRSALIIRLLNVCAVSTPSTGRTLPKLSFSGVPNWRYLIEKNHMMNLDYDHSMIISRQNGAYWFEQPILSLLMVLTNKKLFIKVFIFWWNGIIVTKKNSRCCCCRRYYCCWWCVWDCCKCTND